MWLLGAALFFTFTVRQRVAMSEEHTQSASDKIVGLFSILLWLGVGVMGRAIGLF
jgi:hypothetical protein